MAIQTITYSDKQAMGTQPSVPEVNKITDSNMNEIKSVVNNNANFLSNNSTYSTTEQVVGTWIDGKPIYRKVVAVDFPTTSTPTTSTPTINYPHNISNIAYVISVKLIWWDMEDARWYNYFKDTTGTYIQIDGISNTQIRIKSAGTAVDWHARTAGRYAIIEYTKTTD